MPFQRRNVLQIGNSKNRVSCIFRALQDIDRQLNHKNYALDSARSRSWDKGGGTRSSRPLNKGGRGRFWYKNKWGAGGPGPSPGSATARSPFHTLYLQKRTYVASEQAVSSPLHSPISLREGTHILNHVVRPGSSKEVIKLDVGSSNSLSPWRKWWSNTRSLPELFWSEIGYRLLKRPDYGFDLELAMVFR